MAATANGKSNGKKSERKSDTRFVRGHDPRRGRGPAKGAPNAGRPPNEFKEFCRNLLSTPQADAQVRVVIEDAAHPAFATMWRAVSDRGYGKPDQSVELTGKDGASLIPVEVVQSALGRVLTAGLGQPPKRLAALAANGNGNGKRHS